MEYLHPPASGILDTEGSGPRPTDADIETLVPSTRTSRFRNQTEYLDIGFSDSEDDDETMASLKDVDKNSEDMRLAIDEGSSHQVGLLPRVGSRGGE